MILTIIYFIPFLVLGILLGLLGSIARVLSRICDGLAFLIMGMIISSRSTLLFKIATIGHKSQQSPFEEVEENDERFS